MKHYRQEPQQGKHYLKKSPLLLLSDLSLSPQRASAKSPFMEGDLQ